jgi:hypothetical protein
MGLTMKWSERFWQDQRKANERFMEECRAFAYTQTPNFAPKFGNEVALNSKSAPGQGRTIHERGTQGTHGPVASGSPPPEGQIFPGLPGRRS